MKAIYVILGSIFFVLGVIGAFLPVLPTTPFLLLASVFLAKGSKRFHNWFVSTNIYKEHIKDFEKNKSMTFNMKLRLLVLSSSMMILSFILVDIIYIRILIAVLIVIKYYIFIFKIKTIK